jgi:hypothetical protein
MKPNSQSALELKMPSRLQDEFQKRTDHLMEGRYDLLVPDYDAPLPVWIDGTKLVACTQEELFLLCYTFHELLTARGVMRLEANVTAEELPRNGRFRVWVSWKDSTHSGTPPCTTTTTYYCRRDSERLRVQMVEHTNLNLPELAANFQGLMISA